MVDKMQVIGENFGDKVFVGGPEIDREELTDDICDAITDSIDMDWTGSDGAKAVVAMFEHRGWAVVKARDEP